MATTAATMASGLMVATGGFAPEPDFGGTQSGESRRKPQLGGVRQESDGVKSLDIAGVRLRFDFVGVRPHRAVLFHEIRWSSPLDCTPDVEWLITITPFVGEAPDSAAYSKVLHLDTAVLWMSHHPGRHAILRLGPQLRKKEIDAALAAALHSALRREGRLDIHAAAVSPGDEKGGVLIVGPKGHGKTSLTVAAALSGWTFLSDDVVVVWGPGESPQGTGLRTSFFLTGDTEGRLPATAPKGTANPSHDKLKQDPETLFPGQRRDVFRIRAVVYPKIADSALSRLGRIEPSAAFKRLLSHCAFLAQDKEARPCLDVARDLALLPTFDLRAGRDALEPANAVRILRAALD